MSNCKCIVWRVVDRIFIIIISSLQSTTGHRPLQSLAILLEFGYSHPAPASRPAQMVTPPGLRASYTTFTETRSPHQNSTYRDRTERDRTLWRSDLWCKLTGEVWQFCTAWYATGCTSFSSKYVCKTWTFSFSYPTKRGRYNRFFIMFWLRFGNYFYDHRLPDVNPFWNWSGW
jgi:hypothetical protein